LFVLILTGAIPYIFFSAKESMLIMVDELMRRSISLTLSKKILPNLEENMKKSIRYSKRMSIMNNIETDKNESNTHQLETINEGEKQEDLFMNNKEIKLDESSQFDFMEINLHNIK
jgi:hypothetical protein